MFKDRFVFRTDKGPVPRAKARRIAVTGTGQCVGTSFTAWGLTLFFAEMGLGVTFTEVGRPAEMRRLTYDVLAIDKRLGRDNGKSVYRSVKEMKPTSRENGANLIDGISWRVILPEDAEGDVRLDSAELARLVAGAEGDVQIFDVSADEEFDSCLLDMDLIVAVTDPMPSKLMRQKDRIRMLKKMGNAGNKVIWAVNRMNDGVSRRQMRGFLKEEDIVYIEEAETRAVYTGEFRCELPHSNPEIMDISREAFTKISHSAGI